MTERRSQAIDILGLTLRAVLAQIVIGAPFGVQDFATVLARTGSAGIAWPVAIAIGCFRSLGVPVIVGGLLIGASRLSGRLWAVVVAGFPTAFVAGSYVMTYVMDQPMGRRIGGVLALWLLWTMVGLVGYGLGRIYRLSREGRQPQ